MHSRLKLLALVCLLAFFASCSTPNPQQQARLDQANADQAQLEYATTALISDLVEVAPRAADLVSKSWEGTLTVAETQELSVLLMSGPASLRDSYTTVTDSALKWVALEKEKIAIREEAGGGWWEEALLLGAAFVGGAGIPTSGPFAPLFGGLATLLERTGLRNRQRRDAAHGV